MKKRFNALASICLILFGIGFPLSAHAEKVRIGSIAPPNNGHVKSLNAMADYVREKTGGRIDIAVFPLGQLGNERSMCSQVQSGTLQMVSATTSVLPNFLPEVAAIDLPFLFPDLDTAHAVMDDPEVKAKLFSKAARKGFVVLGFGEDGLRQTWNTRGPIRTPADFKGLKIRTMNSPMMLATFKAFGASPVGIPFPEVYSALQTRVADAMNASIMTASLMKFPEVTKYMTRYDFHMNAVIIVANVDWWDSLSPEDQKTLREGMDLSTKMNREFNVKINAALPPKMEQSVDDYMKSQNVQITVLTPAEREVFKQAVVPVWDETREKIGADLVDFMAAKVKEHQK